MKKNIIIFTQNVKIESFIGKTIFDYSLPTIFLSTHKLFLFERKEIETIFSDCSFLTFAEMMNDEENERCDTEAYSDLWDCEQYYRKIMIAKNELVYQKINNIYHNYKGYVCCADLGVYREVWVKHGFTRVDMDYYHKSYAEFTEDELKRIESEPKKRTNLHYEVYTTNYNGKKLVFIGKLDRVGYRMNLKWKDSPEEYAALEQGRFETKDKCMYLTTIHECSKCKVPDDERYDVRCIQDGYLPPNYSSAYLKYHPQNMRYYAWDSVGMETFLHHNEEVSIMPFGIKMNLPYPEFRCKLKTILVATSGSGDWTAQKNRSDDDILLEAFIEIAKRFPDLRIIYRCHPTWIYPEHVGVNSINRARRAIQESGLHNIYISTNIPQDTSILSFPRTSLEEDLKEADLVVGEHSVSMIDAGFKKIPFASINLTNRRNLFEGISRFGFPHCESLNEIVNLINNYQNENKKEQYFKAVDKYNNMVNEV